MRCLWVHFLVRFPAQGIIQRVVLYLKSKHDLISTLILVTKTIASSMPKFSQLLYALGRNWLNPSRSSSCSLNNTYTSIIRHLELVLHCNHCQNLKAVQITQKWDNKGCWVFPKYCEKHKHQVVNVYVKSKIWYSLWNYKAKNRILNQINMEHNKWTVMSFSFCSFPFLNFYSLHLCQIYM